MIQKLDFSNSYPGLSNSNLDLDILNNSLNLSPEESYLKIRLQEVMNNQNDIKDKINEMIDVLNNKEIK